MPANISTSGSEVSRLKARIEAELEAAYQGMSGPAVTAKHAFITARMERIGDYQQELAALIGESESMQILYEIFSQEPPASSEQPTRG